MKKIILLILSFLAANTSLFAQTAWQQLGTNTTKNLTTIQCFAKDTLFVFGEDVLLYSTNGGSSFITHSNNFAAPQAGYFKTIDTGFVPTGSGDLFRSSNGGANWTLPVSNCACLISSLNFCNPNVGIYGSTIGLSRSDDGGLTWSSLSINPIAKPNTIRSLHDSNFVFVYKNYFFKSNDAGSTFNIDTLNYGSTYGLVGLSFINDSVGFTASADGKILKTQNQGQQWTLIQDIMQSIRDVYFVDELNGFAIVGNLSNDIYKTTNGGLSWSPDYAGPVSSPMLEFAYDGKSLYVIGHDGLLVKRIIYPTASSNNQYKKIKVYPNPTKDRLYIANAIFPMEISVFQVDGKVVLDYSNWKEGFIDLSKLANGNYFLNVKNAEGDFFTCFVKE